MKKKKKFGKLLTDMEDETHKEIDGSAIVEYECAKCGIYDVIKNKSDLNHHCASCGKKSIPLRILSVGVKVDGVWKMRKLLN